MPLKFELLCPLIHVFDMPRSLAFYRDLLGFEIVEQSSPGDNCDWVWLSRDDVALMLNTMYETTNRPPAPDARRVAAHGDTSFYIGAPDVDAVYAYLRGEGIDVKEPKVAHYGMKQLYLKDPDGYQLCFQWKA
jgi:glyoxylase I family protein